MTCLLFAVASCVLAAEKPAGIIINEDNSHFFGSREAADMTLEGLNAFVDQYAGTAVSHLFLCPNAMRASYRSAARDAIWDTGDLKVPAGNDVCKRWVENAKLLDDRGLDPYAVWIARCREKGISPWLSMRMNDVHDVDNLTNFMHSTFWLRHPDFWRVPGSQGAWVDRALDYGIPEVREFNMKFVRELLERYDPDGLELDWMRFGYHFRPGRETEGRALLTQFMRDVRALTHASAARRGHPVLLGARVPAHPDAAFGLGMDGVAWVREGLVDMLVPTPFWATADFDIPIELWRERIGPAVKNIVLAAGTEVLLRAYPSAPAITNDIASVRGFAAGALHRGADRIYLFNYMDPDPIQGGKAAYRELLEKGLALDTVARAPRRYIVTYRDTVPAGVSDEVVLPAEGFRGGRFRIYIGAAPGKGSAALVAGLCARDAVGAAEFDAKCNGAPCGPAADLPSPGELPGAARALRLACPIEKLRDGYNDLDIQQKPGAPEQQVVWAELRVE